MSGVCGNKPIVGRDIFEDIYYNVKKLITDFKGFESLTITGSYNSNIDKQIFGDMDLITYIKGEDKKEIKKELIEFLISKSENIICPFISEKYKGKRYYNSGEIVTISFKKPNSNVDPCQIDFIIALSKDEVQFKKFFLDLPAEKQGLLLGLVKTYFNRYPSEIPNIEIKDNQEIEYNISSKELQLRLITYNPVPLQKGTYITIKKEIINRSQNIEDVMKLIKDVNLNKDFEDIIKKIKKMDDRVKRRIKGIFFSNITIKSGEHNTPKGNRKKYCIEKVKEI